MAAIFISHSSLDPAPSTRIKAWLEDLGYERIFLDFDLRGGLAVGEDWERRLYREIERCHAVVIVLTPAWMQSKWCFAEFITARAQGRTIIPLVCAAGVAAFVAPEIQCVDLQDWDPRKLAHVEERLRGITDDLARGFRWQAGRPPYTGLESFGVDDAAIFFGRDQECQAVMAWLSARRVIGGESRLLLVHGASGSGKSSLIKAGVLPQLGRARRQWLVLPVFRPERRPLPALAKLLAEVEARPLETESWQADLEAGRAYDRLTALFDRLRSGEAREATVVVAIDQFEELFTISDAAERGILLKLLTALFDPAASLPLLAIATARSDLIFPLFEAQAAKIAYDGFPLAPMPLDRVPKLVTEPARVAGLFLEPGLAGAIAGHVRASEQLPLLAFTLRDLYDRSVGEHRLTLAGYDALGDAGKHLDPIANAVSRRSAETMIELRPSVEEREGLKDAFIPHLVRLKSDDGLWVRHPAMTADLPASSLRLIRGFVAARLLVERAAGGGETVVEVAHEALFTAWPLLTGWLDEERAFLSDLERLWDARRTWLDAGEAGRVHALLGGYLLGRGRHWMQTFPGRFASGDFLPLGQFIAMSAAAADEAAVAASRRDRRAALWRRTGLVAAVLVAVMATAGSWFLAWNYLALRKEKDVAEDNQSSALTALSAGRLAKDPAGATKLALAAMPAREGPDPSPVLDQLSHSLLQLRERRRFPAQGVTRITSFSPNGRQLLVAAGRTVAIWDIARDAPPHQLDPGGNATDQVRLGQKTIGAAAFSPDGEALVIAYDASATVRDSTTFESVRELLGHEATISCAAFSHDGRRIVTAANDLKLRLFDARSGSRIGEPWPSRDGIVSGAAFSRDGTQLVTISVRRIARIWDVASETSVSLPTASKFMDTDMNDGSGSQLATFSPDGTSVAAVSADNAARTWAATGSHAVLHVFSHGAPVRSVAFSSDGKLLVTASDDRTARVWDAANEKQPLATLAGHGAGVVSAAFSDDGRRVVTASLDGTARIWDARSGSQIAVLLGHTEGVTAASFSPDGRWVVTMSRDETARLWDVSLEGDALAIPVAGADAVAFSPGGETVAVGSNDGRVWFWKLSGAEAPTATAEGGSPVRSLAYVPGGASVIAGYDDGTVRRWDAGSGSAMPGLLPARGRAINRVGVSGSGGRVVTVSGDGTAVVSDAATGRPVTTLDAKAGPLLGVAVSPDGTRIVATGKGLTVWDGTSFAPVPIPLGPGHHAKVATAQFSADGRRLVTASYDHTAIVWDGRSFERIATLDDGCGGRDCEMKGAVFSPDGTRIATASNDKTVRLWDTASGREFLIIGARTEPFVDVAFSPDGRRLATVSSGGVAQLWDVSGVPAGHMEAVACAWLPDRKLDGLAPRLAFRRPICADQVQ